MPSIQYGNKTITYTIQEKTGLKNHYIHIQKGKGVILRGRPIPEKQADQLILKKARWILDKLEVVSEIADTDIVTGSRMPYLGRNYYVEIFLNESLKKVHINFTASKFKVSLPKSLHSQENIQQAFEAFYRKKAKEKITPRVYKWSQQTGLSFGDLKFKKMKTRWGSCSHSNNINLNIYAVKLPPSLIDYLIVHELAHTKVKNHSKEFWAEVARHLPGWRELDVRMGGMRL